MTPDEAAFEAGLALAGVALVVVAVLVAIFTLRYRITNRAVEVLIFGACVRRVWLHDIASVRRGSSLWNEHWTNFRLWNSVTLRRKTGLIKNFVITPENPTAFIAELARKRDEAGYGLR
ncbi:MAG: hypothetical protein HZA91_13865 [Verrucomicrobia bacterium]|nr:hypothetical protein [Verrucomicrobiota bacterium]